MTPIEITVFEKTGGPLTKKIGLDKDGQLTFDSAHCRMSEGIAYRATVGSMDAFAGLISGLKSNQAYSPGRINADQPERVKVVKKEDLNGRGIGTIARSRDYLSFPQGAPGLVLLDYDAKEMPKAVKDHFLDLWGALTEVLPAFETVAYVERASTSSGLRHRLSKKEFPGSGGRHITVPVVDAADIPRFLSDLHDRCWLNGFGWGMVGEAGQFLLRAIIDKSVGKPERLVFEGAPDLDPQLEQREREAKAHEGYVLDTRLCEPLNAGEKARLGELVAAEKCRLLPLMQEKRASWCAAHVKRLVTLGTPEIEAQVIVGRWIDRKELGGTFPLPFDDGAIAGKTVQEVLIAPEGYIGKTMADPFEGIKYGRNKAILLRRSDGSLFIDSFAHGGVTYELKAKVDERLDEWDAGDDPGPIEPRPWLLGNQFCRGFMSSVFASGGTGKTSLRLLQFISMALGRSLCGQHVFQHCRVLLVSLEDDKMELQRRIQAVLNYYGIERRELKGWLFCKSVRGKKLAVMNGRERQVGPLEAMLREAIERLKIDVLCLDPFVKTHSIAENDNIGMDFVADLITTLADDLNIAVDSPHHVHKGLIEPGDADAGRGASGIKDAARLTYTLTPMGEEEAKAYSIPPDQRLSYVRLDKAKVNLTARGGRPEWFRLVGVRLGNTTDRYPNGDEVQVAEPWNPPDTWDGLSNAVLNKILDAIATGLLDQDGNPTGERFSDANAATDRAVWSVFAKHLPDRSDRQCRDIVRAWRKSGLLYEDKYHSNKARKDVTGLFVDNTKRPGTQTG